MHRTTISLPEELAAHLQREARRKGVGVSHLVREAIEAYLDLTPGQKRSLPFAALGRSGHRSTARDVEEILRSEWDRDSDS